MNPVEEIKARLDIVDIVSESGVQLRKSGRHYMGFCPFHNNTRTPAFAVYPESQTWRCFGACADGGDIFSYVMRKHGWDFKEALQQLAKRANVTLEELTPKQKKRRSLEEEAAELVEAAADYFHQLFLYAPQAEGARAYIQKRGFTEETIAQFKIGFALNSWDACRTHFLGQGYSEQDLLDVGLLTENPEKGTRYDRFRNRVLIPIRDASGRSVGFGARTLDPDGVPKYLNSPQTLLFDKSKILFGLDMAKRHIRDARQAVIVEGYMDVISAWQGGFKNVVAQMGTALTSTQLQLLKRVTKRFVIALDADAAGVNATLRSLNVARETLDRDMEIRFDPTGLIREEGRLQADIRIANMPEGEDPDSIIQKDPAAWTRLIKEAKTVVEFVTSTLIEQSDRLDDPIVKTDIAQRVIPLIRDISNPVARDHYWQYLARMLRIDERALRQLTVEDKQNKRNARPVINEPSARQPQKKAVPAKKEVGRALRDPNLLILRKEEYFLAECLANPMRLRKVNIILSEIGQPIVHAEDFSQSIDRAIFLLIHQSHSTGSVVTIEEMWDSLESYVQQRVTALQQIKRSEAKNPIRFLVLSILECRLSKEKQLIAEIKQLLRDARRENNEDAIGLLEKKSYRANRRVSQLDKAKRSLSSLSRRV